MKTRTLAPGAKATLQVSMRVAGRIGLQRMTVDLIDTDHRHWRYLIETTIYPRVRIGLLGGEFNLPETAPGKLVHHQFDIEFFAGTQESLPSFSKVRTDASTASLSTGDPVDECVADSLWVRRIPVSLSFKAPSIAGPYQIPLIIDFSCCNEQRVARADMSGIVRSLFETAPHFVFFEPSSGESSARSIVIRRTDGKALSIKNVDSSSRRVTVKVLESHRAHDRAVLVLTLDSEAVTEPLYGDVAITTDDGEQSGLKVPFAALPAHRIQGK